jgi:multiple sugar transport system substrate-binding protein
MSSEQNRPVLSRRAFLQISAAAMGGAVLAACTPAVTPGGETAGGAAQPVAAGVEMRLSAWADVQDAVVYENIVNAWHEQQSNYKVTVEQYPGGYYEKIQANFAAGDPADVLYYQGWSWQSYAENKVIVPLDDYIQKDSATALFPEGENYFNTTKWQGGTYMTPTDVGSLVIYYNKDLFDKQDVPHPTKGWTWEEFTNAIEKLTHEENGTRYYGWAQAGGWNGAYGRFCAFMRRNGHVEWDEVIEPKTANWDHEDVTSALQTLIYDAIQNQWSPSPDVIAGGGVGVDTGRVAMVFEGPWYMPRLWGELATNPDAGINFDVAEPPVGAAGRNTTFGHVHGHCMTEGSENKDGGWELIKFILGDEGQKIIAQGGRMCGKPENIDAIWGPIASETYNFTNVEAFSNGMREGATPLIMGEGSPIHAYGGGPITALWDKLLGQQQPAAEALAIANTEIQAVLDQYWKDKAA